MPRTAPVVQSKSWRIMRPAAELSPGHEASVVGEIRSLAPRMRKGLPFSAAGMRDEMSSVTLALPFLKSTFATTSASGHPGSGQRVST